MWLFGLFLIVPLIEIWLFITVGGAIGVWPTIGAVILTAVIGGLLMRAQGARAWRELQSSISEFRDPSRPLAHGAMILLAGALLMTPGFFTDITGLMLLVPQVRDWIMRYAGRRISVSRAGFTDRPSREPHRPPFGDGVIDADFVDIDPDVNKEAQPRPDHDVSPTPERVRGSGSGWTRH